MAQAIGAVGGLHGQQLDGSAPLVLIRASEGGSGHRHREVCARHHLSYSSAGAKAASSSSSSSSSTSLVSISATTVSSSTGRCTRDAVSKGKLGSAHVALAYYSHHRVGWNIDPDSCTCRCCCLGGVFTEFSESRCSRHRLQLYEGRRGRDGGNSDREIRAAIEMAVGGSNRQASVNPLSSNWRHFNGRAREIDVFRSVTNTKRLAAKSWNNTVRRASKTTRQIVSSDTVRRSSKTREIASSNTVCRSSKTREIVSSGDIEPEEIAWDKRLANSVHLIGRAGHDVDIKYLDTGKIVASLRLAVKRLGGGGGGQNPDPDWVVLELWGDLAETAANFVQKGRVIYVSGRLAVDSWTDRETGKKQYATKVVVGALKFIAPYLDSSSRGGGEGGLRGSTGRMAMAAGGGGRRMMPSASPMSEAGAGDVGFSSLPPSLPSLSSPRSSAMVESSPGKSGSRWQGEGRGGWFSSSGSPTPPSSSMMSAPSSSFSASTWSAMASAQEQQWETFFADPDSWWDNRIGKRNPRAPDFKHKETKQSLWLGGKATPAWVGDRLAAWDRAKQDGGAGNRQAGVGAGGRGGGGGGGGGVGGGGGGMYRQELHEEEVADGGEGEEGAAGDDDGSPSSEDEGGLLGGRMSNWGAGKMEYNSVSGGDGQLLGRARGHGLFSDQDLDNIAF